MVLARRLGFLSALRAPSCFLPDPDLSRSVKARLLAIGERLRREGDGAATAVAKRAVVSWLERFRAAHALLRDATSGRHISRHMAWP